MCVHADKQVFIAQMELLFHQDDDYTSTHSKPLIICV